MHLRATPTHAHLLTLARIDVGIVETPSLLEHSTLFSAIKGRVLGCGAVQVTESTDHIRVVLLAKPWGYQAPHAN